MSGTAAESVTEKLHVPKRLHSPLQGKRKSNPIRMAVDNTIKAMIEQGSSVRKIATALNISASTVQRVRNDMKALTPADDLKSGLMSPRLGEMSVAVIDHFLKKGATLRNVKGSDAMAAVKAVAERQWPVQQATPAPRVSFIQINVDCLRSDLSLDATPTTICSIQEGGKTTSPENPNDSNTYSVP